MDIYRIKFINQDKVYIMYAENVEQADIFGFIAIKNLVFGETSGIVIDPAEEKLKSEFADVTTSLIPMQSIIRIDQVKKQGKNKILDIDKDSIVMPFPTTITTSD